MQQRVPVLADSRAVNLIAWTILVVIAAALFRDHLFGRLTFLGNPDRLNHSLKILSFFASSIGGEGLHAWNVSEMLGYDSYVQPYTFPNPIAFLVAAYGADKVLVVAGYVSFALLALAGCATYAFVRELARPLPAFVAAVLYECSAISILKVSQNDMSFAVLALVPVAALIIRRASSSTLASTYIAGTAVFFPMLQFCFIQKTAYALIFAFAYGGWRWWQRRDTKASLVLVAAAGTAIAGAAPRLLGLVQALSEYVRVQPGEKLGTFSDLFRYQGVRPYQILRWFEDGMFGKYFSDATTLTNGINLSEGFLLYTSALVPVLVLAAMSLPRAGWSGTAWGKPNEARFFLWFMLLTFAVALLKPASYLFHLLFLKIDFYHARFLVVGLLPLVSYVALYLDSLGSRNPERQRKAALLSVALAVLVALSIELLAHSLSGHWRSLRLEVNIDKAAAARAMSSAAACIIALAALYLAPAQSAGRSLAYWTLSLVLALQAAIGADFRLNGAHTRDSDVAFRNGDFYFADRSDFVRPSADERSALHKAVERDAYRSVVVCDTASAGGFCAAHVGQFWDLRLADGYYGIGVPARVAMLPWPNGLGLRQIVFTSKETLPWGLLGFLNVKYALLDDAHLYRNRAPRATAWPKTIPNPNPVLPRAFFAGSVAPVRSAAEAKSLLFDGSEPRDPTFLSVVEGLRDARQVTAGGAVKVVSRGDRMEISFDAAPSERFLVINELYTPRWFASIGGNDVQIFPTNVVMRGLFVPPGATAVTLTYTPTVRTPLAGACYVAALLMFLAIAYCLCRRRSRPDGARA